MRRTSGESLLCRNLVFSPLPVTTWLCCSSLNTRVLEKSVEVGADVALLDLEDSVLVNEKTAAREALIHHFEKRLPVAKAVRVNNLTSRIGLEDLLFLVENGLIPEIVVLPKVSLPSDVMLLTSIFSEVHEHTRIFAVIETVNSLWQLRHLEYPPPLLAGVIFGSADFALDMGIDLVDADMQSVKQEIILSAKRLGITAVDSPCFKLGDDEALIREITAARKLGFDGKVAIHPTHVHHIRKHFMPTEHELEEAARIVRAAKHTRMSGAILREGGQMVGPPFIKRAQQVLSRSSKSAAGNEYDASS